jgi:hypothetical protein
MATTVLAMLQHIDTTYGILTPEGHEANRLGLSKAWNPESRIEELWGSVNNILCRACNGHADISEVTTLTVVSRFIFIITFLEPVMVVASIGDR